MVVLATASSVVILADFLAMIILSVVIASGLLWCPALPTLILLLVMIGYFGQKGKG